MTFFLSVAHIEVQNTPERIIQNLYYWVELAGNHVETSIMQQIPRPLVNTGHVINSSSCGIYSTMLDPHPRTILRGQCLTSV